MSGFDYKPLGRCQYGMLNKHNEAVDCGTPATYRVWWSDDTHDAILVCQEHFDFIKAREELDEKLEHAIRCVRR